jgi:hypothetical protein
VKTIGSGKTPMTGMRFLCVLAMLGAYGAAAAENKPPKDTPALRQRAEDLAGAASQRFTDILDKQQEVAQSGAPQPATKTSATDAGTFAPVWSWLSRSSKSYQDVVIAQLKNPDGWVVVVQRNADTAPTPMPAAPAAQEEAPRELHGWTGLVERVRDWLARANRSYRNEIVTPLRQPSPPETPSETAQQPPQAAPLTTPMPGAAAPLAVAPQAAPPVAADAAEATRKAEERIKREAEAADAKRRADADALVKHEAEAERLAAQAEAKRKADAAAKVEAAAQAKREAAAAEAKRKSDAAEAKRTADAQAKRVAAEAESKRKADETRRRLTEEADAERKAVAEAQAETKRQADIDAEATRRTEAAARAKRAARAEIAAAGPSSPAPAASAAPASISPPTAKNPPADASTPPASAEENSAVAVVPPGPAKAPAAPPAASQAAPKARQETVTAEPDAPPTVKKKSAKRAFSKSRSGQLHAQASGHKRGYAHKKNRRPHYAYAHGRKHLAPRAEATYAERRCDCLCGRLFAKPRNHRHAARAALEPRRVHVGETRPYRMRPHKHRRGSLTYRHRHLYIR